MSNPLENIDTGESWNDIYNIKDLLKPSPTTPTLVATKDPFITHEYLEHFCSLFSKHESGLPNYIAEDAFIKDLSFFSEDSISEISNIQLRKEKITQEVEKQKEKLEKEKEESELKIMNAIDNKIDKFFSDNKTFVRSVCPVKIPYKSTLSHEEHELYLKAFIKFQIHAPLSAAEKKEYQKFLVLQDRVIEEQKCFMNFSYEVAQVQLKEYNTVSKAVKDYLNDYVKQRCKRVVNYKKFYYHEQGLPLCPLDPDDKFKYLKFTHCGHLLSLGYIPKIFLPFVGKFLQLGKGLHKKLSSNVDCLPKEGFLYKQPVSHDPNAAFLAQTHRANIVISSSTLKVLCDNHGPNFDKDWDIPIKVQTFNFEEDGKSVSHRVVFIDKPMPKRTWRPLEARNLFLKKALLFYFCKGSPSQSYWVPVPDVLGADPSSMPDLRRGTDQVSYGDLLDSQNIGDSNTFGQISSASFQQKKSKRISEKNKRIKLDVEAPADASSSNQCSETCSFQCHAEKGSGETATNLPTTEEDEVCVSASSFLDTLLNQQSDMLRNLQSPKKGGSKKDEAASLVQSELTFPWTETIATDWTSYKDIMKCPPDDYKTNVHYQLFTLACDRGDKLASNSYRVIVRHNLHAMSLVLRRCKILKSLTHVFYPKIESQPFFGCEVNTLSEITHQWVKLLVSPNSSLLQVRATNVPGQVFLCQERDLATVVKEGKQPHIGFNSSQVLGMLYMLFHSLCSQPSGNYLLHHDGKTEAFIHLMKSVDKEDETVSSNVFNLHALYEDAAATVKPYSSSPWLAIDTHVLTPFHMKHKKIPASFPMAYVRRMTKQELKKKRRKSKGKKTLLDLRRNHV